MRITKSLKFVFGILIVISLSLTLSPIQGAAADKPIILKFSTWHPSPVTNMFANANTWILREVEKRSKGRVKMEYYWSGSLLPAKKNLDGIKSGIADMGFVIADYFPGKLPLLTVGGLPAVCHDYFTSAMTLKELMKMPEIQKEMDANNIVYLSQSTNISGGIWTRKKVSSIAELKGQKIVVVGVKARVLKALGMTPVSIISSEIYPALDKGTVDGAHANPGWAGDYKWPEVAPYYFELMLGSTGDMFTAMNKKTWNKLPADIKKMFLDLQDESIKAGHKMYQTNAENNLKTWVGNKSVTATKPSKADVALLEKTAKQIVWDKWVADMKKKGLAGQKVLDKWRELYKKYDAQNPFK